MIVIINKISYIEDKNCENYCLKFSFIKLYIHEK